jgi:sugar phosphate isomerase/epimerase
MKLCFSTLACPAWSLDQIVDGAAAGGMQGIDFRGVGDEIDITKMPAFNENRTLTIQTIRARGLEMPCLNTSVVLVTPAPERWEMMLDEAQRHAELSRKSETKYLRVFGGAVPRGMTREEARAMSQRHLRQLVKICHPHNCQPLLETHDDWSTSSEVLELLHEFGPAEVGVLWDIEHPYRKGESPAETVTALRRYLRHVHFKDSLRPNGKSIPKLLGEGDLPIAECVHVLKETGYDGWICLETEKRWASEAPEPEQSIPQFSEFMRKIW